MLILNILLVLLTVVVAVLVFGAIKALIDLTLDSQEDKLRWRASMRRLRKLVVLPPVGARICGTCHNVRRLTRTSEYSPRERSVTFVCGVRVTSYDPLSGEPVCFSAVDNCNSKLDCRLWEPSVIRVFDTNSESKIEDPPP